MKSQVPLLGLLLFTVLIVAACAAPAAPVAPAPPASQATLMPPTQVPVAVQPTVVPTAAPVAKVATLSVAQDATLGRFLADEKGNALYLFTKDDKNMSNCYDKCATAWPPLLSAGQPKGMDGINASLLGTTQRKDGSIQVTYNSYPLYYYVKDEKPGDVKGQGVGDVWYVISPEGEMVKGSVAGASVVQSDKQDTGYYK